MNRNFAGRRKTECRAEAKEACGRLLTAFFFLKSGFSAVEPIAPGEAFYAEVRRYWPALQDGALLPGYAGMRPKISGPGEPAADFVIHGPAQHGVPGLVNLFGIESPGLTSSMAIGRHVAGLLAA